MDEIRGGLIALVEIDSADDGFKTVGEDDGVGALGAIFLATAHANERFVAHFSASKTNGFGADEGGTDGSHDALLEVILAEEIVGNDQFKDGITEKFETLIVLFGDFFVFVDITAMSESGNKEINVIKFDAEAVFGEVVVSGDDVGGKKIGEVAGMGLGGRGGRGVLKGGRGIFGGF